MFIHLAYYIMTGMERSLLACSSRANCIRISAGQPLNNIHLYFKKKTKHVMLFNRTSIYQYCIFTSYTNIFLAMHFISNCTRPLSVFSVNPIRRHSNTYKTQILSNKQLSLLVIIASNSPINKPYLWLSSPFLAG